MDQMAVHVPVLTFLANEHLRNSPALAFHTNDDIEFNGFADVAIDERIESKATKSKFTTEVDKYYPVTNCQLFLLII